MGLLLIKNFLLIVLCCIPAIIIRFIIVKGPLSKLPAAGLVLMVWFILLYLSHLMLGPELKSTSTLISAVSVTSFFILISKKYRREEQANPDGRAKKLKSKGGTDYIICSSCKFEQWYEYPNCAKCGKSFE